MRLLVLIPALWLGGLAAAYAVPPPPAISAQAWLLVDHYSGSVLAEQNADIPLPPASLTKLMTAYLVFEKLRDGRLTPSAPVQVSAKAARMRAARMFLRPNQTVTVEALLKGMIIHSANDAAVALAEHVAGSEAAFVAEMNARAQAWGMTRTNFANATGLDEDGHVSTARDMSRIASALIRDFPEQYRWFALKEYSYKDIKQYNSNALLWRDDAVDGVKTGHTRLAGYCLIASAKRGAMRLIATVLGARSDGGRVAASQRLLDYGFTHFETRLVYAAQSPATEVRVWMGDSETLPLGPGDNIYLTLPRGWYAKLRARLTVKDMLYAPVRHGQKLGVLVLQLDEQVFAEYPLVALREIGNGGLFQRAVDGVRLWFH